MSYFLKCSAWKPALDDREQVKEGDIECGHLHMSSTMRDHCVFTVRDMSIERTLVPMEDYGTVLFIKPNQAYLAHLALKTD